jgi:outer membrane lipoprotein-sorting protein
MTERTTSSSSLLAALLASACAVSASAQALPEGGALLDSALAAPSVPYSGHVMVTQWYGKQTRAEEMIVRVLPPDRVRREFLAPDGTVARVSISDGDRESVLLVRSGKTVLGNAVRSDEKVLAPELERETLLSNYDLSVSTAEKVAGRATWKLNLVPKVDGKSWQTLWIDQETRIVLRTKRWQPRRRFVTQAQFMSFEPRKPQNEELFRIEDSTDEVIQARSLSPEFLTLEQLGAATGGTRLPEALPGGFVFESADVFEVRNSSVRHARYTDGLTVLSVFETDRPVKLPKGNAIPSGREALPGPLRASLAGKVLQWKVGPRNYTMMGDVSRDLMAVIARKLP